MNKDPMLDTISRLPAVLPASVTLCNLSLMVSYDCLTEVKHVPVAYYPYHSTSILIDIKSVSIVIVFYFRAFPGLEAIWD